MREIIDDTAIELLGVDKMDTSDMKELCDLGEQLKEEYKDINSYADKRIEMNWSQFRLVFNLVYNELKQHGVDL